MFGKWDIVPLLLKFFFLSWHSFYKCFKLSAQLYIAHLTLFQLTLNDIRNQQDDFSHLLYVIYTFPNIFTPVSKKAQTLQDLPPSLSIQTGQKAIQPLLSCDTGTERRCDRNDTGKFFAFISFPF